jgi:glutamate racemase
LNNLVDDTKRRIEKKIYKFYNNNINVHNLDQIRKMIDDEITISDISNYSEYIPFKYFNIEKKNKKYYLRTHFPLIKEILEDIIMKESIKLFDGEIKYNGNVIGSFLELNIINHIKNKNIKLDIDAFVKVDSIHDFGKIIEEDTDNFT